MHSDRVSKEAQEEVGPSRPASNAQVLVTGRHGEACK